MFTSVLLAVAVAAVVAGGLTPVLAGWAHRRELLDVPNERSSHVVATPRIGGVALVYGVLAGVLVLHVGGDAVSDEVTIVLAGAVAIAFLGMLDDFRHLPALVRLAVHAAVSIAVVMAAGAATLPWIGGDGWPASVLTVFWLVTLTNAYNFMDGIDGIAGAQALVAGMGWAAIGLLVSAPQCTALGLVLAAASGGFLVHNWHPAKVFMGDAGSGFFGFLFGGLPLAAPGSAALWWCAVLLMWPFLLDASFTLIRRACLGENILAAHRSHVYQRLVITGRSHRYVTLVYAGLALLGAVAAVLVAAGHLPAAIVSVAAILGTALVVWRNVKSREALAGRLTDRAIG